MLPAPNQTQTTSGDKPAAADHMDMLMFTYIQPAVTIIPNLKFGMC